MVNKKGVEVFSSCLFVLSFGYGLVPYPGTRGTPVDALDDTIITYNDR